MPIVAYNLEDEERRLKSYLETTTAVDSNELVNAADGDDDGNDGSGADGLTAQRVYCCNTSRSLYCPECCKVLVPKECWPQRFIDRQKQCGSSFPFGHMDIVLGVKERRTSSTGIQLMCISNMIAEAAEKSRGNGRKEPTEDTNPESMESKSQETTTRDNIDGDKSDFRNGDIDDADDSGWWNNIKLYDLNEGDTLPEYSAENPSVETYDDGTYVLFPQEGKSVPISAVANKIKRLVVLDIKWSRSYNVKLFSEDHHKILVSSPSEGGGGKSYNPLAPLKDLPFVHLEYPPKNSNFWRWHNRGAGMLSTIEAIYFAAREASVALRHQQDIGESEIDGYERKSYQQSDVDYVDKDNDCVDILWLFALQRSIIQKRSIEEGRPVAFSEEAKAMARALREQDHRKKR